MKHLKVFALTAMVAALTTAFGASSAAATVLSSTGGNLPAGTSFNWTLGGTTSFTTTSGTIIGTCTGGSLAGKTTSAGGEGSSVTGIVEKTGMSWLGCTKTTDTLEGGTLEVSYTSGVNGTVVARGFKWTWAMVAEFGGTCSFTFGTGGTTLGTLVGSNSSTTDATLAVNAIVNGAAGNSFLCPSHLKMVANYTVTAPTPLMVTLK